MFGWLVPDLRAVIRDPRDREIELLHYEGLGQDDDGIWTTPSGDLVTWFQDPDSNVLSLTQLVQS